MTHDSRLARLCLVFGLAILAGCTSRTDVTLLESATSTTVPDLTEGAWSFTYFPGMEDRGGRGVSIGGNAGATSIGYSDGRWLALGGRAADSNAQLWQSFDGVVWEPVSPVGLTGPPVAVFPHEGGGWSAIGGSLNVDPSASADFWWSADGETWHISESYPETRWEISGGVIAGFEEFIGSASVGLSTVALTWIGRPWVMLTDDGGKNWIDVPIEGTAEGVTVLDGGLAVVGELARSATIWRRSTGWQPESANPPDTLASLDAMVEIPGGGYLAVLSRGAVGSERWFVSEDLLTWSEVSPPDGSPPVSRPVRLGPWIVVMDSSVANGQVWISRNGATWVGLVGLPAGSDKNDPWNNGRVGFDGTNLIGLSQEGLTTAHPVSFVLSDIPGAWELVHRFTAYGAGLVGAGSVRWSVEGGSLVVIEGRRLTEIPDAPVTLADDVEVFATSRGILVRNDLSRMIESGGEWIQQKTESSGTWLYVDGEWKVSGFPEAVFQSGILELEGWLVVATIEDGEIRSYRSEDGVRWLGQPIPLMHADYVTLNPVGWLVASSEPTSEAGTVFASRDGVNWGPGDDIEWSPPPTRAEIVDGVLLVPAGATTARAEVPADLDPKQILWTGEGEAIVLVNRAGKDLLLAMFSDGSVEWISIVPGSPWSGTLWIYRGEVFGWDGWPMLKVKVWNPNAD